MTTSPLFKRVPVEATEKMREALWRALFPNSTLPESEAALIGAAYDAMLAASPEPPAEEVETGWQPIETAPKDCTEVLCYVEGFGMGLMVLYWNDGYWREKANGMGLKTAPTHWMPLPPSPSRARAKGGG